MIVMSGVSCTLCCKTNDFNSSYFANVKSHIMPSSQKTLAAVLQHLANLFQTKLVFQLSAIICINCLEELKEYDMLMVKLLTKQKKLSQKLENSLKILKSNQFNESTNSYVGSAQTINKSDREGDEESDEICFQSPADESEKESSNGSPHNRKRIKQECLICGMEFRSKYQLTNHMSEAHSSQKDHTCSICGVVRRDEEYLELHMNIHQGKTEHQCRFCPKTFSRPVNTLRHMRVHWDKKKFQCEKCGERFSQDNLLYNHRLKHEAEENPIICEICNQSFKSKKTFNHHALIHQENRRRYECSKCPKSFTERYTLKVHLKTHHSPVACSMKDAIGKEFNGNLKEIKGERTELEVVFLEPEEFPLVIETVETNEICVICNMCFDSKTQLESHLEEDHDVVLQTLNFK